MEDSKFDRSNSSQSSNSSSPGSSSNFSNCDSSLDINDQSKQTTQANKQPSSAGLSAPSIGKKRFFVSRVNPQQILTVDNSPTPTNAEYKENVGKCEQIVSQAEEKEEEEKEEFVSFRYTWPVRISERLIGSNESAILNVSPPFCTAHNGVQFTWLLRICEENILDFGCENERGTISCQSQSGDGANGFEKEEFGDEEFSEPFGRKKVNITLYYKEGPSRDVRLRAGNISIRNAQGLVLFNNLPLPDLEYTKGGGWSPICSLDGEIPSFEEGQGQLQPQRKFSKFIHASVGKQIIVRVQLEMPARLFQPLQYLPSIDSPFNDKLEGICAKVLDQIRSNQLTVPDLQFFDPKTDKYALYRHIYQFACQEIFRRFGWDQNEGEGENCADEIVEDPELMDKIRNIFAHYYFNSVIVREAECFEDFLDALDASRHVQFPALRRECERYICAEVMAESADLPLVKKMLLLAERFNLPVLKMVSFGVIVDRLLMQQKAEEKKDKNNAAATNSLEGQQTAGELSIGGGPSNWNGRKSVDGGGSKAIESSMEEIREELLEIAEQIIHPADHINFPSASPNQQLKIDIGTPQSAPIRRVHSKSLCSPERALGGLGQDGLGGQQKGAMGSNSEGEEVDEEGEVDGDWSDQGGETLVGSVIAQLEELARHIRKVSMPPGVGPAPMLFQNARPSSPAELAQQNNSDSGNASILDSRRSSLKTGRDILLLQNCHRQGASVSSTGSGHSLNEEEAANFEEHPPTFITQLFGQQNSEDDGQNGGKKISRNSFESPSIASKKESRHPKFAGQVQFLGKNEDWPNEGNRPVQRKNAVAPCPAKIEIGPGEKNLAENEENDEGVEVDLRAN